jgi:hypothetical protein
MFSFPRSELAQAGTWTATVSYESDKSKGTSAGTTFEVQ